MRVCSLLLLLSLTAASCGGEDAVAKPNGVLPEGRMIPLMWDLLQAEELALVGMRPDSAVWVTKWSFPMYGAVLRKHGIEKKTLEQSLDWYRQHPDVFSVVIDSLQRRSSYAAVRRDTSKVE